MVTSNWPWKIKSKLEPLLQKNLALFGFPGYSVGIIINDEVMYTKGFGVKILGSQERIDNYTNYHMGSISKPLVATAIVQLVEKGKIDLDASINTYLPYFKLHDERYKEVTIRQFLTHSSGMPDVDDYEWDNPQFDEGALERYVQSLINEKLKFQPGERFEYSNMAYEILGDVISKVSSMSFEDYMNKNIFQPLNMNHSSFLLTESPPKGNEAISHIRLPHQWIKDVQYPYNRIHAPSSTLHSNPVDMCQWALANLNHGQLANIKILESNTHKLMVRKYHDVPKSLPNLKLGMALSWFVGTYKDFKVIMHSGSDRGFQANFILLPETKSAVITFFNSFPTPQWQITSQILNFMLEDKLEPLKVPITYILGEKLMSQGIAHAVEFFHKEREKNPDKYDFNANQFSDMALILIEALNKKEAAKQILELGLNLDPENLSIKRMLERLEV